MIFRRPFPLSILCLFYLAVFVSLPVQIAVRFEHEWTEWSAILMKVSDLTLVVMVLCLLNSWLAFTSRSLLFITSPILLLVAGWNNWLLAAYDPGFSMIDAGLATLGFGAVSSFVLLPAARHALLRPSARWRRSAKRYQRSLCVELEAGDARYLLRTFDISMSGVFLTGAAQGSSRAVPTLECSDPVEMKIQINAKKSLTMTGEVVRWARFAHGHYPIGVGVRFAQLGFRQRMALWLALVS